MAKRANNKIVTLRTETIRVLNDSICKELVEYFASDKYNNMSVYVIKRLLWELTYDTIETFKSDFSDMVNLVVDSNKILAIRDEIQYQYRLAHPMFLFGAEDVQHDKKLNIDPITYSVIMEKVESFVEKPHKEPEKEEYWKKGAAVLLRHENKPKNWYGSIRRLGFDNIETEFICSVLSNEDRVILADIIEEKYNSFKLREQETITAEPDALNTDSNSAPEDIEVIGTVNPDGTITLERDLLQEVDAPTATVITPVSKNSYSDILSFIQISDSLKEDFELETLLEAEEQIKEFLEMADRIEKLGISMPVLLEKKEMLMEFFEYSINLNKAS